MRAGKLTDAAVKQMPTPGMIWDQAPKVVGFGVRAHAGGVKSFFLNYRIDGVERRHTIGRYPAWSVDAARDKAKKLRKQIDDGHDPAREKRERRRSPDRSGLDRPLYRGTPALKDGEGRGEDQGRKKDARRDRGPFRQEPQNL